MLSNLLLEPLPLIGVSKENEMQKRPKNFVSLLRGSLSEEMFDESLLLDHVKIEDYLMVALGIRLVLFLRSRLNFKMEMSWEER